MSASPRPPVRPSFASVVQLKHVTMTKSTPGVHHPSKNASALTQTKAASPDRTSRRRGRTRNYCPEDDDDRDHSAELGSPEKGVIRETEEECVLSCGVLGEGQALEAGEPPYTSERKTGGSEEKDSMRVPPPQVKVTSAAVAAQGEKNKLQPKVTTSCPTGTGGEDNGQIFQSPSTVATTSAAEATASWASPPSLGDTSSLSPASVSSSTSPLSPSPPVQRNSVKDTPNRQSAVGNDNGVVGRQRDGSTPPSATHGLSMLQLRRRLAILSKEQLLEVCTYGMYRYDDIFYAGEALLETDPASRRVMVRGLWFCTTDASFRRYFEQFGELENAAIIRQPDGRSQGYGFLIYRDRQAAQKVIEQRHVLDDRAVTAKLAADQYTEFSCNNDGQSVSLEKRKLFIRNICSEITKEILEREFSVYGPIEECAIIRTAVGVLKGYGFVTFTKPADAQRAAQIPFRVINGWVVFVTFSTGKARTRTPNTGTGRQPQQQQFHPGDSAQIGAAGNSEFEAGYQAHQFAPQYNLRSKGYGGFPEPGSCYSSSGGGGRQPSRVPLSGQRSYAFEKPGITTGVPIINTRAPSKLKGYHNECDNDLLSHERDPYGVPSCYEPTEKCPIPAWNGTPSPMDNEVNGNPGQFSASIFGNGTPDAHECEASYMRAVKNGGNDSLLSLLADIPQRSGRGGGSQKDTIPTAPDGSFFEDDGVSGFPPGASNVATTTGTGLAGRRASVRWKDECLSSRKLVDDGQTENQTHTAPVNVNNCKAYSQNSTDGPLRNDSFWEDGDDASTDHVTKFLQSHNPDETSKSSFFVGGNRLLSNMTKPSSTQTPAGNSERDSELTGVRPTTLRDAFPLLRGTGPQSRRRRTTGGSAFALERPDDFVLSDGCNSFASTAVEDIPGLSATSAALHTRAAGVESQYHQQSRNVLFPFVSNATGEVDCAATQVNCAAASEGGDSRSSPFDRCANGRDKERLDGASLCRSDMLCKKATASGARSGNSGAQGRSTDLQSRRFSLPFSEGSVRGVRLDEKAIADMVKTQEESQGEKRTKGGFFRAHCRGTRNELPSRESVMPLGLRFDSRAYTGGEYLGTAASKAVTELAYAAQQEDQQGNPGLSGRSLEIFTPLYSRATTAVTTAMGNEPLFNAIGTLSTLNSIDLNLDPLNAPRFPSFGGNLEQLFGNPSAPLPVAADVGAMNNSSNGFFEAMGFPLGPPGLTAPGCDDETVFARHLCSNPAARREFSTSSDSSAACADEANRENNTSRSGVFRGESRSVVATLLKGEDVALAQKKHEATSYGNEGELRTEGS